MSGPIKSFQQLVKVKIATVTSGAFDNGMIIFRYKLVKGGYYEVSGLRKTGCGHLQNGS